MIARSPRMTSSPVPEDVVCVQAADEHVGPGSAPDEIIVLVPEYRHASEVAVASMVSIPVWPWTTR